MDNGALLRGGEREKENETYKEGERKERWEATGGWRL